MVSTSNIFRFNGKDPFDDWSINNGELAGYYPRNSLINSITKAHSKEIGVYQNSFVIKGDVKFIKRSCFRNNQRFENVTLSEGLLIIEDYSFHNATLKSIVIPKSVKRIGKHAFSKGTTLLVHEGSYAERYAIKNGFNFVYCQENG